ncbi:uncharacterized protein LOC123546347 [Mercenaria mercenaria]|uniref:uncharacterized protein LOC123546347 n=1 Tax=Mercenaria mercenaria TaxID=6596 RepID=UPI00234F609F|nr:uncharacterized protein LOC123546347 [Mercenaria mercenaria]
MNGMATSKMFGRSQIDASDALHEFSCSPCSEDGKNSEAWYHCSICQAFYCQRCVDVHNKFTKNHSVSDKTSDTFGQEFGKSAKQNSNDLPTDVCEEHHGEVVKMFCGHHNHVCCTVCIAVKHRSCDGVEYIPNIASGLIKSQEKDNIKISLQKVKADLKNLKSKVENDIKRLDKQRDDIIDNIQEFKKRIIARVEELERKSLHELESKHKELTENINAYNKQIGGLLKVIDVRLHKLTHAKDDNKAQTFVDVKNGEKELSEGNDLAKQTARDAKSMAFKMNTDIEEYLSKNQSLGTLQEYTSGVNIVCPVETRITSAFISELQSQLQSYDIQSECTKASEIVADRYTIVLCEHDSSDAAIKHTTGIQENTIILMRLCKEYVPYLLTCLKAKVKGNFRIEYVDNKSSISFAERNKRIYESISNIVMGHD